MICKAQRAGKDTLIKKEMEVAKCAENLWLMPTAPTNDFYREVPSLYRMRDKYKFSQKLYCQHI